MSNIGSPPPSGGDNRNLGPILVGLNWMVFGPATILVCLRVGTRIWITRNLGWDDFTIVLAQVGVLAHVRSPDLQIDSRSQTAVAWDS